LANLINKDAKPKEKYDFVNLDYGHSKNTTIPAFEACYVFEPHAISNKVLIRKFLGIASLKDIFNEFDSKNGPAENLAVFPMRVREHAIHLVTASMMMEKRWSKLTHAIKGDETHIIMAALSVMEFFMFKASSQFVANVQNDKVVWELNQLKNIFHYILGMGVNEDKFRNYIFREATKSSSDILHVILSFALTRHYYSD